jgi:uncharacterized protein
MSTAAPPATGFKSRVRAARWLTRAGLSIALVAAATVIATRAYYPRFLYPAPRSDRYAPGEGRLLTVQTRDGVSAHATELVGPSNAPVIVFFHGNGVTMGDELWMAREFRRRGIGVVLCEYRGYGLSTGPGVPAPSEEGLYKDAEAVLGDLAKRGVAANRIALFGESLGTGVAVEMAARGYGSSLTLVTPYTSIPEVASRFVFGLPTRLLMRERFDSFAKAPSVALPTLIVHGTADEVVPYAMGEKLSTAFPHARLLTLEGGHHTDSFLGERAWLFDEVAKFVRQPR